MIVDNPFVLTSEGYKEELTLNFDKKTIILDSSEGLRVPYDETLVLNNSELSVRRPVPFFESEGNVSKALRVKKDGTDYEIYWEKVSDLDNLAVLFGTQDSEADRLFALTHAGAPLYYDPATRTVYLDLNGKEDIIGDGKLLNNNGQPINGWLLDPRHIYNGGTSEDSLRLVVYPDEQKLERLNIPLDQYLLRWKSSEADMPIYRYPNGIPVKADSEYGGQKGNWDPANGLSRIALKGLTKNLLYWDPAALAWRQVTTATENLTPLYLKPTNDSTLEFGLKYDNTTIMVNSRGQLISNGIEVPDRRNNELMYLMLSGSEYDSENLPKLMWGEAGKVDDVQINGITTVKNKISNILLDNSHFGLLRPTLEYRANTSEFGDSERHLAVNIYNALPQRYTGQTEGKALILNSENVLEWGEAGKVDALRVSDALGHTKQLDPVGKIITVNVDKGLQITSEGEIIHINEVRQQTTTASGDTIPLYMPNGVDEQGHLMDTSHATGKVGISLRQVTMKGLADGATTYDWVTINGRQRDGATDSVVKHNLALKIAGYDSTNHNYNNATLKVDAAGLSANYKANSEQLFGLNGSEGLIEINGNVIGLKQAFLDRIQSTDFRKGQIDSEGLRDPRYYPTIQLLDTELAAKQDLLTPIWPISISSEDILEVHYDGRTIVSTPSEGLVAADVWLSYLDSELYLSTLIPNAASEGNILVDFASLYDAVASNLGRFIGNYDSEGGLPTKAQVPNLERNDYAFITVAVETSEGSEGSVQYYYHRYKYVDDGSESGHWEFEYRVYGNTFTNPQLEAINSR